MREYIHIIHDYLTWLQRTTLDDSFLPEVYLSSSLPPEEINIRKAKVWKEILELCYKETEGIYWFAKFILGNMTYAGYPQPIRFNKLWWEWAKLAKQGDHIALKCPRQHGKSSFWTVVLPIYRTALFEHYNVLIESASEDQAIALLAYVIRLIENNEFLLSKRSQSAKWSTMEIVYNGGKIMAKGVGSEVRGGTYDYICCDDVLRSDNKLSDEDIEHFIDEELEPMLLVRRGQLVIVGTPKSETDIFSTIEERVRVGSIWIYKVYTAITDWEKKTVLCPDRFSWDQLMRIRKGMGVVKFDKEFQCRCISSGSQLFPYTMRKRAMDLGRDWKMYSKSRPEDIAKWRYYIGADCARAGTAGGDYTVVFVLAFNPDTQEKRIVWYWRKKGLKIREQVEQIAEMSRNFDNPVILVEKNNIGQEFIDMMVDNYNLNVEPFQTSVKSKDDLIRYLLLAFENEKIIMPTADEFSREMMEELDRELDRFVIEVTKAGNEVMKGSGHSHDDMVMALALANRCSQSAGFQPMTVSYPSSRTSTALERYVATGDYREIYRF